MDSLLNILPGYQTCPPGVERKIIHRVPALLIIGSFIILFPTVIVRLLTAYDYIQIANSSVKLIDIVVIGTLVVYWLAIFTIAIGAFLVRLMKGPAYVADAYPMEDIEPPIMKSLVS